MSRRYPTVIRIGARRLEVPADGFCPSCCALADEACHRPDGSARPDHKRRHPMPTELHAQTGKLDEVRDPAQEVWQS